MKRLFFLLFTCLSVSTAFPQTAHTGFKQLQFSTKMIDGTDFFSNYWNNIHLYFMKGHKFEYACITCPPFDPQSCLLIGDSTLTLITLDKNIWQYSIDKKEDKKPKSSFKTINVSQRFAYVLCSLIDLGSLTSNAYDTTRLTHTTPTYFLSSSPFHHSSKTIATGSAPDGGGNEASHLMDLINKIRDAVAGEHPLDETELEERIRSLHKRLFTYLPTDFVDRKFYEIK